jgi:hypothetical protein
VPNYDKKMNFDEIKAGYRISTELWVETFCEKWKKVKLASKLRIWILTSIPS